MSQVLAKMNQLAAYRSKMKAKRNKFFESKPMGLWYLRDQKKKRAKKRVGYNMRVNDEMQCNPSWGPGLAG